MEIGNGLLYLLYRRSSDQNELARQQLNLLREHQGLAPIPSRHDNPTSQALVRGFNGAIKGMCAWFGALGGAFVMWMLLIAGMALISGGIPEGWDISQTVLVWPATGVGLWYGWKVGWAIGGVVAEA